VTDKNTIRIQYLALRKRIDQQKAAEAAHAVAESLLKIIPATATIVAGYRCVHGELDISVAMEKLGARGHTLCLPAIEAADKPLHFRRWRIGEVMEKGRYGVEVPPSGAPVFKPNIVLVPLVAFDKNGHRLGYGAGYYDRTIQGLRELEKSVEVIGVAYSIQQVEHLPFDPHDAKLDIVVTEKNTIRFN
jgi:5-formyltetrahydrofolate cyclo-ligase